MVVAASILQPLRSEPARYCHMLNLDARQKLAQVPGQAKLCLFARLSDMEFEIFENAIA